jgi:hypothetical protein
MPFQLSVGRRTAPHRTASGAAVVLCSELSTSTRNDWRDGDQQLLLNTR